MTAASIGRLAEEAYREAPRLDRSRAQLRPFYCPLEELLERIPPRSDVLDIGCGLGVFVVALIASGRAQTAIGVDLDPAAIETANAAATMVKSRFPDRRLDFQVASVVDDWPRGPFDVVSMIDVMHHLPVHLQRACFSAAAARVRPGGAFIYKDMCRSPWWRALANRATDLVVSRQWIHYVPARAIERWGADERLSLIERADFVRWAIYGHELFVFRKPEL